MSETTTIGLAAEGRAEPKAESKSAERPGLVQMLRLSEAKKLHLIVAAALSTLSSVLSLAPYLLAAHILGLYLSSGPTPPYGRMIWLGVAVGLIAIVRYLMLFGSIISSHLAAFDILHQLRLRLCAHLGKLSMGWFSRRRSGQIKKIIAEDVEDMELFIAHHIPDIVTGAVQPLAVVVCLMIVNWRLALVALVPVPVAFILQRLAFGQDKGQDLRRGYHDVLEDLNGAVVEYVRGMPVVKIFNLSAQSFSTLKAAALAYKDFVAQITYSQAPSWAAFVVVTTSGLTILLPFGLWMYLGGSIDFPTLALFLMLGAGYLRPLFKLAMMGGNLGQISEALYRIEQVLEEPPMAVAASPKSPAAMDISFQNVCFDYDGRRAIDNVSFNLAEGGVYALVGPSGAGKSTVGRLIARMWDVGSGRVALGGVDLRDIDPRELMDKVGLVFQETYLFSDTIRENIRMGLEASDEEVMKAAEAAQCLDFIGKLPEGLGTLIGEGGEVHLSGGERQRISMARIMLRNPPVIILDEATVFTDAENEAKIQAAFARLMRGRTVIVIAHRLSTVIDCDAILALDHGRLVQHGTHEALLAQGGLYKAMWEAHQEAQDWRLAAKEGAEKC
jgi:ATP-binding cassette subfamily B protein